MYFVVHVKFTFNKGRRMAQYDITYLGGNQPSSPEEGKQRFAKYKAW